MVSPEKEKVLGVLDLVRQEQADRLQALLPAVNVVPEEEVVGLRGEATVLKEPKQVRVLPVDVPAYLNGSLKLQEVGLLGENLPRGDAQAAHLRLRELHGLARAPVAGVQQAVDQIVHNTLVLGTGGGGGEGREEKWGGDAKMEAVSTRANTVSEELVRGGVGERVFD